MRKKDLVLISSTEQQSRGTHIDPSMLDTEGPPRKIKSLREIYEKCNYALMIAEPICYEKARGKEEWENAMKE